MADKSRSGATFLLLYYERECVIANIYIPYPFATEYLKTLAQFLVDKFPVFNNFFHASLDKYTATNQSLSDFIISLGIGIDRSLVHVSPCWQRVWLPNTHKNIQLFVNNWLNLLHFRFNLWQWRQGAFLTTHQWGDLSNQMVGTLGLLENEPVLALPAYFSSNSMLSNPI